MQQIVFCILLILCMLLKPAPASCGKVKNDALPSLVGQNRLTQTVGDETLMEVARREGFGYETIANSNRNLDPWNPGTGSTVTLPEEVILPAGALTGITINLAELRLFHIVNNNEKRKVNVYPLGIGRAGRETPEGLYRVTVKKENPDWRVPAGLRKLDSTLPEIMPPGPENPLGRHWLGLSAPGYGVHGTNRPFGVGRRVSYGCLRMYAKDIEVLYRQVDNGTSVLITYQPIKAAWDKNTLYLEIHPDYLERYENPFQQALSVISKTGWPGEVDYAMVKKIVTEQNSLPQPVGSLNEEDETEVP